MQVEWIGAGRKDADNSQASPSRLLNMYRENLNGKAVLKGVPGTESFCELGGVFMRAMAEIGGQIYAANGGMLYRIDRTGAQYLIGEIISSPDTEISSNNGKVAVAAGGDLFVFDGTTRTVPDTGSFYDIGSVSFIGQRTIITERNGRRVQWSGVADAETYDALDFATAEQRDDVILRGEAIGGQYWVFKTESIEQWYLTGADNFITYRPGSLVDIGLKSFGLFCQVPNGGFIVGSDNIAYIISGGSMQPVSVRGVETALNDGTADRCYYYEAEGHKFCVIRFSDRPAWVYDISMNEWHERSEGVDHGPWTAVDAVPAYGGYYIGTARGSVRKLTNNNYDTDQPLFRRAVSSNLRMDGEFFSLDDVEFLGTIGQERVQIDVSDALDAGTGLELDAGDGNGLLITGLTGWRGAEIILRLSKDRGETFGVEREKSLGELGEYDRVLKYRAFGTMRNACLEVTVSDPVNVSFDAIAEVKVS